MSFRSGSVSYSRFRAFGQGLAGVDERLLATLGEHVVAPPSVGKPPEFQAGFCGGRHVLDESFEWEHCGFGSALLAGLRIDSNRMPAELRRAYVAMAEAERAAGTETGFLSRPEKRAAKEEAERRCDEELADGRHRRSKLVPFLWDLSRETFLAPMTGDRAATLARDLFQGALGLRLQPRSAGSIAWDLLADRGLTNDFDDARPAAFTAPPSARGDDGERRIGSTPEVPWAASGPEPKDFLGNEFLLWLWHGTEAKEGLVETAAHHGIGTVAVVIDRVLELDCAWGVTGRTSLRGEGPTRSPEAAKALQHGKWPRRCGLVLAGPEGRQWQLDLHGDRFAVASATLPEIDEAGSVREVLEQRLERTLELDRILLALYETFLRLRISPAWESHRQEMAEWVARRAAARVAA